MLIAAIAAAIAAAILVQEVNPAGRYQVASPGQSCTIRLQASLPGLPEALIEGEAQSGFAFATPGCPFGLEALSLWRYSTASGTLALVDGAGEVLLTATRIERDWQGQSGDGLAVRLTRD